MAPERADLKREHVYREPIVDGRRVGGSFLDRVRHRMQSLLISRGEREEAGLERRLRTAPGVTRPNVVVVASPKGGVGKTTSAFLVGNVLSTHLKLRAVAVDANPDFGTLADLAPDRLRCDRSLEDLRRDAERVRTAAGLGPYMSRLPSGLHLLAAPRDAETMAAMAPDDYGELLAFLSLFYEVVLLDLGTGLTAPIARFALERADQLVLLTTPEWITSRVVLTALEHLHHDRTTVVVNKAPMASQSSHRLIEERLRQERLHRSVILPYDEQLQTMLDSGTYSLEGLRRRTRVPIKELALAVSEQLV